MSHTPPSFQEALEQVPESVDIRGLLTQTSGVLDRFKTLCDENLAMPSSLMESIRTLEIPMITSASDTLLSTDNHLIAALKSVSEMLEDKVKMLSPLELNSEAVRHIQREIDRIKVELEEALHPNEVEQNRIQREPKKARIHGNRVSSLTYTLDETESTLESSFHTLIDSDESIGTAVVQTLPEFLVGVTRQMKVVADMNAQYSEQLPQMPCIPVPKLTGISTKKAEWTVDQLRTVEEMVARARETMVVNKAGIVQCKALYSASMGRIVEAMEEMKSVPDFLSTLIDGNRTLKEWNDCLTRADKNARKIYNAIQSSCATPMEKIAALDAITFSLIEEKKRDISSALTIQLLCNMLLVEAEAGDQRAVYQFQHSEVDLMTVGNPYETFSQIQWDEKNRGQLEQEQREISIESLLLSSHPETGEEYKKHLLSILLNLGMTDEEAEKQSGENFSYLQLLAHVLGVNIVRKYQEEYPRDWCVRIYLITKKCAEELRAAKQSRTEKIFLGELQSVLLKEIARDRMTSLAIKIKAAEENVRRRTENAEIAVKKWGVATEIRKAAEDACVAAQQKVRAMAEEQEAPAS